MAARGTRLATLLFFLSSASFLLSHQVFAADAPETADPKASCVSSECHTSIGELPHLHWSDFAKAGECQECHEADGDAHEYETDDSNALCLTCHEEISEKMAAGKSVHEAAEDGCIDCHNPHGGQTELILEGITDENLKSLCFDCHETEMFTEEVQHGPVGLGACNQCHDPHASPNNKLLRMAGKDLCGDCHEEIVDGMRDAKYVHDPAEDDCTDCHDPHSSPYPLMLFAEKRELCNECHDDIVELAENSSVDHSPTTTDDECITCHAPHSSNFQPNLRKPQRELCLDCHDKRVESGGSRLLNMKSWLKQNPEWHKPVVEDDCTACHDPHGSEHFRILKESFPERFYNEFDIKHFDLCFSCHEKTLVTKKSTRSLTGFRDGKQNLHFLHVNRKKKGRSCRACHEVHASQFPLHLAESVRFGRWMMPLNYESTETGGSCHPGCHAAKSYDRTSSSVSSEAPAPEP